MWRIFSILVALVELSVQINATVKDSSNNKFQRIFSGRNFEEECGKVSSKAKGSWLRDRNVEEFVNTLGGTNSRYDLSRGSTLPLITRPWGFNSYAPMTDDDPTWPGWWFHPSDRRFFGMRVTHQPSPWIKDYGNFLIKGYMPNIPSDLSASRDKFTGYSPHQSEFHPYYFGTSFFSYGNSAGNVRFELSPTQHGGMIRLSFPKFIADELGDDGIEAKNNQIRRVAIVLSSSSDFVEVIKSPIDGTAMIAGYTKKNSGGVGGAEAAFAHYFVLAIYNNGAKGEGNGIVTSMESTSYANSTASNAWIDLSPEDANNDVLIVRFATSFISKEQALHNLQLEVPSTLTFDDLVKDAQSEWRSLLSRVKITEPPVGYEDCKLRQLYSIFYTSLYRASIFPRQISEVDVNSGNLIHWSPYATTNQTRTASGALSTDSGFWDAWNTIYPILALFHRPMLGTAIQGWINAYQEGGWLPKWASPGYRGSMVGTMGDVSLADAIVNGIPNFDVNKAYEAIRKDAFEVPPKGVEGVGRVCLQSYLKYGYIPRFALSTSDIICSEVVSRTLNYFHSDYAIAQAAIKLNFTEDAKELAKRYQNFSILFDSETGFFRSKQLETEKWTIPFDQYGWGGDYTEGGPHQFRYYLPYDPKGLAEVYEASGRDMCQELQKTQTSKFTTFHLGGYSSEIHEQTELSDHCWGQYAHNNQPVHHMLYMHMYDGYEGQCSNQGRYWIREVLLKMYKPDSNMFPGDEDNGEMAAWFVLSALGLYQRSPGSGNFELGIPLFGSVEVDISDISHSNNPQILSASSPSSSKVNAEKKILKIVAKNNSYENSNVQRVLWNGKEISKSLDSISYSQLAQGGVLTFELAPNAAASNFR